VFGAITEFAVGGGISAAGGAITAGAALCFESPEMVDGGITLAGGGNTVVGGGITAGAALCFEDPEAVWC
jgi:hypothetical protein